MNLKEMRRALEKVKKLPRGSLKISVGDPKTVGFPNPNPEHKVGIMCDTVDGQSFGVTGIERTDALAALKDLLDHYKTLERLAAHGITEEHVKASALQYGNLKPGEKLVLRMPLGVPPGEKVVIESTVVDEITEEPIPTN